MSIILSSDQQIALDGLIDFLADPSKHNFVIEGYAGTGKSTLLKEMLRQWYSIVDALKLINPRYKEWPLVFSATTHKAADNLFAITGQPSQTIHSLLGLRVHYDFQTGKSKLVEKQHHYAPFESVIFIDEASQMDEELIAFARSRTNQCKIVYMGDPAQLLAIGSKRAPVFDKGFPTVKLKDVQRNGGQILEIATKFRETVETGEFFSFTPDNSSVIWLPRDEFDQKVVKEFTRTNWLSNDSKYLSWTNKSAIRYNDAIRKQVSGASTFQVGDFATVNSYVMHASGKHSLKTDAMVVIEEIEPREMFDVPGNWVRIEGHYYFWPNDHKAAEKAAQKARESSNWQRVAIINSWIDLRAMYGQTVNKSQGSTYKSVFLDLDDISGATTGNLMARLLYVGFSRASELVTLTGDLA